MTGGIATIFTRALHGWTCQSWSGVDISNALGAEAAGITRDKWDCNHSIRGLCFFLLYASYMDLNASTCGWRVATLQLDKVRGQPQVRLVVKMLAWALGL